jgi:hypothetical protein
MNCNQELSGIMYNKRALWNQEILTEDMVIRFAFESFPTFIV